MPDNTRTILNVDDTEAIRYAKTRTLERAGFRVLEAGTGADALRLVAQERPDLVLLDVKLPDLSGHEVCSRIKAEHPDVLVMQVSAAHVEGRDRVKGLDSGADSYLPQPAEPDELLAAVRALLRIRRAEDRLRESEARLSAIFGQTTAGIALCGLDGRFTLVNDRYCALVGRSREELMGLTVWDITHPADVERNNVLFAGTLQEGGTGSFEIEKRYVRPDGEDVWVHNTVNLIRENGSPKAVLAVTLDIRDRRASEERQRLLARELDHRAKNMLAVVQAMLRLTRADSTAEFIQAVEGRVAALARAHTLLSASRWEGANLLSLLREELAPFLPAGGGGGRVKLRGPDVSLAPDAAQAFSMVLHELTTNAAKYGCLSVAEGRLDVSWSLGEDGRLRLTWAEAGGPPVKPPTRTGFGSTVIEHSVTGQLDGTLQQDWLATGLITTMSVPRRLVQQRPEPAPRAASGPVSLRGKRVLVVEGQALLALEMVDALEALECDVVGPAGSLEQALTVGSSDRIDAAVLDLDLRGQGVQPLAHLLGARGVPFLVSGERAGGLDLPGGPHPVLRRPFDRRQLEAALRSILRPA
ncbi:MAG TPA: response regulator [Azospirillaceae bacterium]|nr:response regulator [Azospirillaceae bacterium]